MKITNEKWLLDISHHQQGMTLAHMKQAKAIGVEGLIIRIGQAKGGKYGTTKDRAYKQHLSNARTAGLGVSLYFYIGDGLSPRQNAELAKSWAQEVSGWRDIPMLLDAELGSGSFTHYVNTYNEFKAAGFTMADIHYIPLWYWRDHWKSPRMDLALPGTLWSSRYPDNAPDGIGAEYADVPPSYWNGYGGLAVEILQFTSSGRVGSFPNNLDVNAFRGSKAELWANLFHMTLSEIVAPEKEEEEMHVRADLATPTDRWQTDGIAVDVNGTDGADPMGFKKAKLRLLAGWGNVEYEVYFTHDGNDTGSYDSSKSGVAKENQPVNYDIPTYCTGVNIAWKMSDGYKGLPMSFTATVIGTK